MTTEKRYREMLCALQDRLQQGVIGPGAGMILAVEVNMVLRGMTLSEAQDCEGRYPNPVPPLDGSTE